MTSCGRVPWRPAAERLHAVLCCAVLCRGYAVPWLCCVVLVDKQLESAGQVHFMRIGSYKDPCSAPNVNHTGLCCAVCKTPGNGHWRDRTADLGVISTTL